MRSGIIVLAVIATISLTIFASIININPNASAQHEVPSEQGFGNRVPALLFNATSYEPNSTNSTNRSENGALRLQFALVDSKTNDTIRFVAYIVEITRTEGNGSTTTILNDVFRSPAGPLILDIEQPNSVEARCLQTATGPCGLASLSSKAKALIYASADEIIEAFRADSSGTGLDSRALPIKLKSDELLKLGTYHAQVTILGIDNDRNILPPSDEPQFDVSWTFQSGSVHVLNNYHPNAGIVAVTPMLNSTNGEPPLDVTVLPIWTEGGNVRFNITFFQNDTYTLRPINYNVVIIDKANNTETYRETDYGGYSVPTGMSTSKGSMGLVTVPDDPARTIKLENGNYIVRVIVDGMNSSNPISEVNIDFPIQVTPEFPSTVSTISIVATVFGLVVVVERKTHSSC